MVCYARPASWLAAILIVSWLVFSGPVSHFLGSAALMVAVTAAAVGAAVAAALAFATFMSTRRRRGAAGGCVTCRFRCQHAMTEQPGRLWLVTTADRRPPGPASGAPAAAPGQPGAPVPPGSARRPGPSPARSLPVLLPMPAVRTAAARPPAGSGGPAAPRWPDRPAHGSRLARPACETVETLRL